MLTGRRVRIAEGSGIDSGKVGKVVYRAIVLTDGDGIPTNVQGAYKPVDWSRESAVLLDTGEIITMYRNRLIVID